jgi:hypothetical protein
LAPNPAATVTRTITPYAANALPTPAYGTSAATITAELAEHGVSDARKDARRRSRRLCRTRVA